MKTQSGLTLFEVMVALVVGVVLLAIGVPSFMSMMSSNRMAGYANDLVSAMRYTRSEAVKRSTSVTICASNSDQTDCSSNNWQNGWIVFVDDDADSALTAGETILRVWSIPTDERANLAFMTSSPTAIRYVSTGANSLDAQIQFSFKKTDCTSNQARQLTITRQGRATVDLVTCF